MDIHYTIREVANRLHKSEQSVVRWLKDGKLPYIEVSERRRLIAESDLNEFLNRRKICPPDKHIDKVRTDIAFSHSSSLTTEEGRAEMNVRIPKIDWRKELSHVRN